MRPRQLPLAVGECDRHSLTRVHPVRIHDYRVLTPPLAKVGAIAARAIDQRQTSCLFVGPAQLGKTMCLEHCHEHLPTAFPGVAFVKLNGVSEDHPTNNKFYRRIYDATGFAYSSEKEDWRKRATVALASMARRCGSGLCVLLIDELQEFSTNELRWLRDLTNELRTRYLVSVITISFALPEIRNTRTVLSSTGRKDVISRFMTNLYAFEGLTSPDDLRQVMAEYDAPRPDDLDAFGAAYTEFFLPHAFDAGFRIANYATPLWNAFVAAATSAESAATRDRSGRLGIGMRWVSRAIDDLLVSASEFDCASLSLAADDFKRAVEASGFEFAVSGLSYSPRD